MLRDQAGYVAWALCVQAGVHALEVPAGPVARAAAVIQADGDLPLAR